MADQPKTRARMSGHGEFLTSTSVAREEVGPGGPPSAAQLNTRGVLPWSYHYTTFFSVGILLEIDQRRKEKEGLLPVRGPNIFKADRRDGTSPATQTW